MKKYLNIFLWVMFFSLMAPSGMALASWNSVPGDSTYSWKIALESGLLAVIPSDKLKSTTHSKLTERRLGEVSKVLSGVHASEGLDNLSAQIITTKKALNKIDNAIDRRTAVELYIQTLNEVSTQLEQEKETRALAYLPPQNTNPNNNYNINQLKRTNRYSQTTTTTNITNVTNVTNVTYTPPTSQKPITNTQTPVINKQPPTNTQPQQVDEPINPPIVPVPPVPNEEDLIEEEIVEEIGETQEEIEDIIEQLEEIIEEAEEQVEQEANQQPEIPQQEEAPQQEEQQRYTPPQQKEPQQYEGKGKDDDKENQGKGNNNHDDDKDRDDIDDD